MAGGIEIYPRSVRRRLIRSVWFWIAMVHGTELTEEKRSSIISLSYAKLSMKSIAGIIWRLLPAVQKVIIYIIEIKIQNETKKNEKSENED